jgi:dienelactone hydrolase
VKTCTHALLALLVAAPLAAGDETTRLARARALVAAFQKKDFVATGKDFDETMKEKMPRDKLEATWKAVIRQVGEMKKVTRTRTEKVKKYEVVFVTCAFAKMDLDVRVVFDKDEKVTGLFFSPARAEKFDPPPYAPAGSYREEKVTVGQKSDWPLPGVLTLPKGKGPFPAVVMLHGSGSHDADETVGANKPLRDLAWGLAARGVASVRFEKRTYTHAGKVKDVQEKFTVKEEVVDDALAAVKLARSRQEIDPKRVFVLGHSLGGMMAPRVGALDPQLRGLILLAGCTRPLEDLVLEQLTYLASLHGKLSDEEKSELEKIKKQVEKAKDPKLSPDTPAKEMPLGAPARYWLALKAYDQKATVAKLKMPILVLQGERDYQVTMEDFAGWKKALARSKAATFKSYPSLNHLFMEGKGKAKPEEYFRPGHVAKEVVEDIATWVKRLP